MPCCDRCDPIYRRTYELSGDGDGVEFLTETGYLIDGGRRISEIVLRALGMPDPR